ncbi:MAG: Gfo/Idh/MocA family oxidoreductase [Pyrinomonadaceae bacterium]
MSENRKKLRIGVCGVGSIGFRHARLLSLRADTDLLICDMAQEHLDAAADLPNLKFSTNSFDELLDSGLDGLIIATPDKFHIAQAEAALKKQIAVLIEKPVAENTAQGERLLKTISETNGKVLVGYPLRHNLIFLKAKELIDEGAIGSPVSFHIMLGSYNTLVAAKNRFNADDRDKLFVDYSHEWDYLNWFLGKTKRAAAVSHQSGNREKTQKPNVVNAILELESGISGTAHLDYVYSPGMRNFTVIGDQGTVGIDAVKGIVSLQVYSEEFERTYKFNESFDSMMSRQIDHFVAVIENKEDVRVTLDDGLNALRIADSLIISSQILTFQPVFDNLVQ